MGRDQRLGQATGLYCQTAYQFSFSLLSMLSELQIAIMVSIEASMLTQSSGILHDGRLYLKPGPEVQCQIHLLVRAAIITETCSKITGDYKTQS